MLKYFLVFKSLLKNYIRDNTVWPKLSFQGSYRNFHLKLKYCLVFKCLLKICVCYITVRPILTLQGSYRKVQLTLIYLLVLKIYWRIVSRTVRFDPYLFLFKDSIKFSLKAHGFFSVSKVFIKVQELSVTANLVWTVSSI